MIRDGFDDEEYHSVWNGVQVDIEQIQDYSINITLTLNHNPNTSYCNLYNFDNDWYIWSLELDKEL